MRAIGDINSEEGQKKLVAIRNYIQMWKGANVEEKEKNSVNNSNIKKLVKLLEYVEGEIKPNAPAVNNSYPESEWYPIIESIWENISDNAPNVNIPPANINNIPVSTNTMNGSNGKNVVNQMEKIQTNLQGIVNNMKKLTEKSEGGKRSKHTKRRKTQKRKMTRKQK